MIDYQKKYLKYKAKYLELKKQMGGKDNGTDKCILNKDHKRCDVKVKDGTGRCAILPDKKNCKFIPKP